MINEAAPSDAVLTIKSLEAFEKAADGQATKLIVPSDIAGVAGLVAAIKETAKNDQINDTKKQKKDFILFLMML